MRCRITIIKSLEHLYVLGALTDEGKLSDPLGLQMSRLPLEPLYAKAMIISSVHKCSAEMLTLIAMLCVESVFYQPRDKRNEVCTDISILSMPIMFYTLLVMSMFLHSSGEGCPTAVSMYGK